MNNILKTEFDINGDIKDKELYKKFNDLICDYEVFSEQELEICDLDFEKEVEYETEYWSGDPDDVTPSYRSSYEKEYMDSYIGEKEPTQEDICLYFHKEPYEITKEDCENIDKDDFIDYLSEKYEEDLYQEAYNEFYKSED